MAKERTSIGVCYRSPSCNVNEDNEKTWRECVKDDMKLFGLQPEWAHGYVEGLCKQTSGTAWKNWTFSK